MERARRPREAASRNIIFIKRKRDLEKKASELATLCGVEVATVIFAPGGMAFSSGHPSPDVVIERFLRQVPELRLDSLIIAEKRKGKAIDKIRNETEGKVWWEKPLEELSVEQLKMLKAKMMDFKDNVDEEVRVLQEEQMGMGQDGESVQPNAPTSSSHGGEWSFL